MIAFAVVQERWRWRRGMTTLRVVIEWWRWKMVVHERWGRRVIGMGTTVVLGPAAQPAVYIEALVVDVVKDGILCIGYSAKGIIQSILGVVEGIPQAEFDRFEIVSDLVDELGERVLEVVERMLGKLRILVRLSLSGELVEDGLIGKDDGGAQGSQRKEACELHGGLGYKEENERERVGGDGVYGFGGMMMAGIWMASGQLQVRASSQPRLGLIPQSPAEGFSGTERNKTTLKKRRVSRPLYEHYTGLRLRRSRQRS